MICGRFGEAFTIRPVEDSHRPVFRHHGHVAVVLEAVPDELVIIQGCIAVSVCLVKIGLESSGDWRFGKFIDIFA